MADRREEVAQKINEVKATLPCDRCGQKTFSIVEGFTNINLQDSVSADLMLGGRSIPVAHIACDNCGALTAHALGALNMLPLE